MSANRPEINGYVPHVDGSRIFGGSEQDVGRAVPKCHHFIGIRLGGH